MDELAATVAEVAGKEIRVKHVEGPVGVHSWNFGNARIYSLGWRAKAFLKACPERSRRKGISLTYPWIEAQVKAQRARERGKAKH